MPAMVPYARSVPVLDLVALPVRFTSATIDTARALARLADVVSDSLEPGGSLERLTRQGGTLDQLVALGDTLERIQPRLDTLARLVPELHASVTALNQVVEPLGQLAGRFPGARRKAPVDG
jgi:hypothetical protein